MALSVEHQVGGVAILGYVEDLIANSPKPVFTREEILVLLNIVKNDPDLFDAAVVAAVERAGDEFDRQRIAAEAQG